MPQRPKKPAVYLVVMLPIFVIGGASLVLGLEMLYARLNGFSLRSVPNLNGLLISLPALLLWIPIALLLANAVLFSVPPLKKAAERYAEEAHGPGFLGSQRQLGKVTLIVALVCVPLIVLGFVL